jgi:hypothetical protein
MTHPQSTRAAARTVVVGGWLVALAVVGDPAWLVVLLGAVLVLVWASPYLLVTNRRPRMSRSSQ